jgi:hypothetical protein
MWTTPLSRGRGSAAFDGRSTPRALLPLLEEAQAQEEEGQEEGQEEG